MGRLIPSTVFRRELSGECPEHPVRDRQIIGKSEGLGCPFNIAKLKVRNDRQG
jgi:hypothetical protein